MKKLARAILRTAVDDFPAERLEYGKAMLAELEGLEGWAALEWALGGGKVWLTLRGAAMFKSAAYWLGLIGVAVLAGFLYSARGPWWAISVVMLGVMVWSAGRPRDFFPVALILGLSLPVSQLFHLYLISQNLLSSFQILGQFNSANKYLNIRFDGQLLLQTPYGPIQAAMNLDPYNLNWLFGPNFLHFSLILLAASLLIALVSAVLGRRFWKTPTPGS